MSATNVRVFDCGDEVLDRYTVVYLSTLKRGAYMYQGMSQMPTHPQGFCQWGEADKAWVEDNDDTEIQVSDLPFACQRQVQISLEGL